MLCMFAPDNECVGNGGEDRGRGGDEGGIKLSGPFLGMQCLSVREREEGERGA